MSSARESESIWEGNETVWHAWEPECDACGLAESSFKDQLLSCSGCLVAKYCTKECQKRDWSSKTQCHLYEANRKLSSVFAKSLGPGYFLLTSESFRLQRISFSSTINDPKLSLADKMVQWNFLNIHNHLVIAAAALKNNETIAGLANVAILLSLAPDRAGSKYEHRTFFIDRVLLLNREASNEAARTWGWTKSSMPDPQKFAERTDKNHFKLMAGWCLLPGGKVSKTQLWQYQCVDAATHVLPPGFDLNRYITHVNRGITHFHASFWPLPRRLSDADIASAAPPPGWKEYALRLGRLLAGLKGGQDIVGIVHADGTREPVYKGSGGGHFRRCAPGETDSDGPVELKKLLVDPSKMVQLISKHLEAVEQEQLPTGAKRVGLRLPVNATLEDAKKLMFPGHCSD
ncbi:hypothetical protein B0H16DRAFT_1463682 [Mycena metata]|uniref:MYND-type domain-containing protein n=1 Tax=Mycena metata TaxID=1033252 RepID=A0AAD7IJ13_9AGAR|nr:hypothetical protein B0H16DRAFT_1463682 [Mycena metata]